eukprot:CAMPEP_0204597298 /NCGR_PEP_ID=MMETSP0661-20131031/53726_1 /ASSEMBLY_ACC=CAM_ASM_000606 /TAXON_ID=109239 /ORGANISM="Alexandrium margalefi, Strain AMGDE01CS-322" /LENGTH=475 /DNA_ID=CAMNT_0051607979 /DNA_START=61 /DNA_END=1488 /DNA_ORIENTATION=-
MPHLSSDRALPLPLLSLLLLAAPPAATAATAGPPAVVTRSYVYGKYYSQASTLGSGYPQSANTYYVFTPEGHNPSRDIALPFVLEFHGGGFTGGSATRTPNTPIAAAVANGMAWISVDYRLVATKYYYGDDKQVEELIHVDAEGRLTLDTAGKTMDDYIVRRGRQEFNTKCSYDAAQALEHIIEHATELGVDVHRIATTGSSAGGGEIHYLTWVYHSFPGNAARYTPVGMVYTMAQLDYPVQNMLDHVWGLWADDVGADTKLSAILDFADCGMIVGNPWCPWVKSDSDYNLCNATYNAAAMARFCASEQKFNAATIGDARDELVWPRDDPEVGLGMEMLWYNSVTMQKHQPKPSFYLYISNSLNATYGMSVVHNALYARNYARFAEKAGINYTVYYTDYQAMTTADAGELRFEQLNRARSGTIVYNYRSSHSWIDTPGVQAFPRGLKQEQTLYFCFVFGIKGCRADLSFGAPLLV